jgi:hypothetical protein
MVSSVPLTDLVRKITTDYTGNRLGEFREMIATMLSAFVSEVEVCSGAVKVMQNDVQSLSVLFYNMKVGCVVSFLSFFKDQYILTWCKRHFR